MSVYYATVWGGGGGVWEMTCAMSKDTEYCLSELGGIPILFGFCKVTASNNLGSPCLLLNIPDCIKIR
jgi:hypothetical protein